jgi:hypothetical protein
LVRVSRIGRMYKLLKLTKLLRILKIIKAKNNLLKYANDYLKIGLGFERLAYFMLGFMLILHVTTCLWILVAKLENNIEDTWLSDFDKLENDY